MSHDFGAIIFSWIFLILLVILAIVMIRYMRVKGKKKRKTFDDPF